jgi:ATP-dependent DNA helicase RecG
MSAASPDLSSLVRVGNAANAVLLAPDVSPTDLARHAVGLANSSGGTLVVGVRHGKIAGAEDLHPLQVTHALWELTSGKLTVHCANTTLEGKPILVVSVPRSPVVLATPDGEVLHWNGLQLEPLAAHALDPAPLPDFSASVPPTSSIADIDPLEVHRLRGVLESRRGAALAELPDLDLLRALGLLVGEQPNLAGILLCGTSKALKRYAPQAEIDYYHHATGDLEFEFRETIHRPIPAMLERLRELIQARNKYKNLHVGLFQIEVWDFDEVVYREAILNALVHRDYTSHDTVQLHHYPSRLEVANPGGFSGGINASNILRHQPKRRNPILAEALARLGYIERAGIGVDRMYRLLLRSGKEPPEYTAYPDSVQLSIHNPDFDEAFTRFVARKQEEMGAFSLDTLIVLSLLKREQFAEKQQLSDALQLPLEQTARALRPLEEAGLLEKSGEVWQLSSEALYTLGRSVSRQPPVAKPLRVTSSAPMSRAIPSTPTPMNHKAQEGRLHKRQTVLEVARALGSVANRDVRLALGLNLSQASHLLRTMQQAGLLLKTGDSPRETRYIIP